MHQTYVLVGGKAVQVSESRGKGEEYKGIFFFLPEAIFDWLWELGPPCLLPNKLKKKKGKKALFKSKKSCQKVCEIFLTSIIWFLCISTLQFATIALSKLVDATLMGRIICFVSTDTFKVKEIILSFSILVNP